MFCYCLFERNAIIYFGKYHNFRGKGATQLGMTHKYKSQKKSKISDLGGGSDLKKIIKNIKCSKLHKTQNKLIKFFFQF